MFTVTVKIAINVSGNFNNLYSTKEVKNYPSVHHLFPPEYLFENIYMNIFSF